MQKGKWFENQIEKVIEYIEKMGGHGHKNHANRTQEGIYLEGEPFDFEIFTKDYKCVFDAKEVEGDTWHMAKKDIVQANNLKKCKNCGIHAYFLICFNKTEVKQIDVDRIIEVLRKGKKSVHKSLGTEWELLKRIKKENEKNGN